MSAQQIPNPEGAFAYATTAGTNGNQRSDVRIRRLRNMSTANAIAVGQQVVWSTLIGDGNEILGASTGVTGTGRFAGIAVTSASTNNATGTSNRSSEHPRHAWCNVVVEGPADAWVTSGVEKGDNLVQGNDTANGVSWGKLAAISTALTTGGQLHTIGWALTTATSATTNRSRIYVKPQMVFGPTS